MGCSSGGDPASASDAGGDAIASDVVVGEPWQDGGGQADATADAVAGFADVHGNTAPTVKWLAPADGAVVQLGAAVAFQIQVADAEQSAADLALAVTLVGQQSPVWPAFSAQNNTIAFTVDTLPAGPLTLRATVFDGLGATATADLNLLVNTPPGAPTIALVPDNPKTTDDITVQLTMPASDPDRALKPEHYRYRWQVDGKTLDAVKGAVLPAKWTQVGQTWHVTVFAHDGSADGPVANAQVTIANTPPTAPVIAVQPNNPTPGDTVKCVVVTDAHDPDATPLVYRATWTLNGQPLPAAGTATTVALAHHGPAGYTAVITTKTGDKVGCALRAFDGTDEGPAATAEATLSAFDPCASVSACGVQATCSPTTALPICTCKAGYSTSALGCVDVDECVDGKHDCAADAACGNTEGGYTCECPPGHKGNGHAGTGEGAGCSDVDECAAGTAVCDLAAACTNTVGSYACVCKSGYVGDGKSCQDVDECATGAAACDLAATCTNTVGGYACACKDGYSGDGKVCQDIDECAAAKSPCHSDAACTNKTGGYGCACKDGYVGDGITACANVDECAAGLAVCAPEAQCVDKIGGYACACGKGWTGDGKTCKDVDECKNTATCGANAACTNQTGGFLCGCKPGFAGDPYAPGGCADIDECTNKTAVCDARAACKNVAGSYSCACNKGFVGDGKTCKDVDECAAVPGPCHAAALCGNTDGSYTCACKPGWTGDGVSCAPGGD